MSRLLRKTTTNRPYCRYLCNNRDRSVVLPLCNRLTRSRLFSFCRGGRNEMEAADRSGRPHH